jgi:hypothetical protein
MMNAYKIVEDCSYIVQASLLSPLPLFRSYSPCSAELISTAYQPWYSIFLSQRNSHSRLISRRNSLSNRAILTRFCIHGGAGAAPRYNSVQTSLL